MYHTSSKQHYMKAYRMAKTNWIANRAKGKNGNIPSLDNILKNVDIVAEMPMGTQTIQLKKIDGTYFFTRSKTFGANFMPISHEESEFAVKWQLLCEHHLNDGITEPIKVYEYLNKYYVMEGNKRVSVLKYFGAYSIEANVTRLIPKRDESTKRYYEFLEFNKKTGINSIWLSSQNSFTELLNFIDEYIEDEKNSINSYEIFMQKIYSVFREMYYALGGSKINITTGDAFLEYVRVYGISNNFNEEKVKPRVEKMLAEFEAMADKDSVEIQLEPFEKHKKTVITSITQLVAHNKKLKVAFIFEKNPHDSIWAHMHNKGRIHVQEKLKNDIETYWYGDITTNRKAYKKLRELAKDEFDIIFSTSYKHLNASLRAALKYSDVKFFNCSPVKAFRNVSTYFARSHEPRFLLGIIAGSMTNTNKIGVIDCYSETEKITGINAFALGVKTVNPRAKIIVKWADEKSYEKNSRELVDRFGTNEIDFVLQNNLDMRDKYNSDFGLYSIAYNEKLDRYIPDFNYAAVKWNWEKFYDKLLTNISNGNWKGMFSTESKRVSFWWGIDSGLIDVFYAKHKVPYQTQKLIEIMRDSIIENKFHTFTGPIYDQSGQCRIKEGDIANYEEMLYMDWFIDNIELNEGE